MWLIIISVTLIIFVILFVNGFIDMNEFFADNNMYFKVLKESDYEFLLKAKYGIDINVDKLFSSRIKYACFIFILGIIFMVAISTQGTIGNMGFLSILFCFLASLAVFKLQYWNLKSYYRNHLHQIDLLLPYYLKGLEILVQHYTVPVGLSKSIVDAPEIFRPGLKKLVSKIEEGDSSIDPYMEFSKDYPVRDSMRMMRLLYRLSLGSQEKKEEQLLLLSKTVSSLQNKAREQKYKERLEKMESKTMLMLGFTGGGVIVLLLIAMLSMMSF